MKLDTGLLTDIAKTGEAAAQREAQGYDGGFTYEISHDPFLPLAVASQSTSTIELGTSIAVAFARNPMTLANTAYDLQAASGGRFVLGLGSQIKPHITKRFSMEWSKPAARMRDFILAMRAIWDNWDDQSGQRLDHRGEFYQHTLMTPMFNPGPHPHGHAKIWLAGVGPLMTQVAGEVADGFIAHAFTTADYFKDVTLPALQTGLDKSDSDRSPSSRATFEVSLPVFNVLGETEADRAEAALATRKQIAFYGSTPAYAPVLEQHGWADVHTKLNTMSKQGEWDAMADLIDDDILATFAIVGTADEFPARLEERWGGLVDRISFYSEVAAGADNWATMLDDIKAIG